MLDITPAIVFSRKPDTQLLMLYGLPEQKLYMILCLKQMFHVGLVSCPYLCNTAAFNMSKRRTR